MVIGNSESQLAAELDRVSERVRALELRLAEVEAELRGTGFGATRGPVHGKDEGTETSVFGSADASWAVGLPALVGRAIIALGGAFLLRAITERGAVPDAVGVAAGLAYALFWTWRADRAQQAGRALDATLQGLTTALIAFPLIAETSVRLRVVSPQVAATSLLFVAGVVLYVAWRRELQVLAWIVTFASTATGVILMFATKSLPIFAPVLFALAAASLAASFHRDWYGLRWPAALALDILALAAMFFAGKSGYEWLEPTSVATVQLLMTVMYLAIITTRTLGLGHPMREFGVIQSLLVLAIGFEGARHVLGPDFAWTSAFPMVALALATASYAVSFLYLDRDGLRRANLAWYTTLGTILAIYGSRLLVASTFVGVIWASMSLAGARLAARRGRHAMRWNVAALGIAAALGSGLVGAAHTAFRDADPSQWVLLPLPASMASGLCLAAWFALRWAPTGEETYDRTVPGLALFAVAAIGIGSAVVMAAGPVVAIVPDADTDLAALAVLRTAVLVFASLLSAGLSRIRLRNELVWIAYAALALAGCKLAIEDLINGSAMTMFMSLVLFGGALIATPQLVPALASNPPRSAPPPEADG